MADHRDESKPSVSNFSVPPENIPGVLGAATRFRMERFDGATFRPLVPKAEVRQEGGTPVDVVVVNVSQSGAALRWPPGGGVPRKGDALEVKLSIGPIRLWDGPATAIRVESDRVGVSFPGLVDLDTAIDVARVAAWQTPNDALEARTPPADGLELVKSLLADFRLLLEDVQVRTARMERELPLAAWRDTAPAAMAAVGARIEADVLAPMLELSEAINGAYLAAGAPSARLGPWARRLLHDHLLTSPFMARALEKPLRYPGDYLLMNYIYRDSFAGDSLFARVMTLFGTRNRTGLAVRSRKGMIREELIALLDRRAGSTDPVRILAVAAGPAEEAWELLTGGHPIRCPVEIVLFEQDRAALTFAYRRLQKALDLHPNPNVSLQFRNDSVTRLIYSGPDPVDVGRYDAIYSCGLFDYFGAPAWSRVARALGDYLGPGGTLWIGNMVPENSARWFMELHLDWHLRYRTEAETLDLARKATADLAVRIQRDPTGLNPFARFEKAQ